MFAKTRAALGRAAFEEALPLLREVMPEDEATRAYLVAALGVLAGIETGSSEVERVIRRHLDTVALVPELADLPGVLIQDLIAPEHRRSAGEFYTPRWLAERTVMLSGFPEADEGVLLDPCCGGGAMLIAAMRLRGIQMTARGMRPEAIASELVARVRGYDLNPLAVLASRVACWAVLSQWIPGELPELHIEEGDALGLPAARVSGEWHGQPSAVARAVIPGGTGKPSIHSLQGEACPCHHPADAEERVPDADFLVGNPPWIRWSDVPAHQADRVREVARELDLIPRQVWHGGSEVDLSIVIALGSTRRHLRPGGRAALVLPRSHLHAPASAPFRRLQLPDGARLQLEAIEDFEAVPAFRGAAVRPVVAVWSRTETETIPRCARFEPASKPESTTSWAQASLRRIDKTLQISPFDGRWCLVDPTTPMISRVLGETSWVRGRKGVTTDLNEAYFVRVLGVSGPLAGVTALSRRGGRRLPAQEFEIEADLLWPLLKGAGQIEPFRCLDEAAWVIVPNSGIQQFPSLDGFASRYPAAAAYFAHLEHDTGGALSRRATYRRTQAARGAPYFLVYNVGDYTFRPFKVVWPEITSRFRAAVALPRPAADGLPVRAVVPDHKVYFASFDQVEPADYLCAFLNAPVVRHAVEASTARLQIGTLLKQIKVPSFDPQNAVHAELARLSAQARNRGTQPDAAGLDDLVASVIAE